MSAPDSIDSVRSGMIPTPVQATWPDEWFDDFITRCERRYRRAEYRAVLRAELDDIIPDCVREERDYQDETEQLRRYLEHEREAVAA